MIDYKMNFQRVLQNTISAIIACSIVMVMIIPHNSYAQNNSNLNALVINSHFGKHYYSNNFQYKRSISKQFSMVGTISGEIWKKKLKQFHEGELSAKSWALGIGGEWSFGSKPEGFFIQGNVFVRGTIWNASAKVKIADRTYFGSPNAEFPISSLLLGVLLSSPPKYATLRYNEIKTSLGIDSKFGYNFIFNNGHMVLSPYIGFLTIPSGQDSEYLTNNIEENVKLKFNPLEEFSNIKMSWGVQWGFLF